MSRRSSDASMEAMMCLRDSPRPFGPAMVSPCTLVATTTSSRVNILPRSRPVAVSLAPAARRGADDGLRRVLVQHPLALGVVAVAHHAEADAGHLQARRAEVDVVHKSSPGEWEAVFFYPTSGRGCGWARVTPGAASG